MLDVRALGSRYGRIPALADVSLTVRSGELVALVGANGAGKTTLLRAISGVQPLSAGQIHFDGADLAPLNARQRAFVAHCAEPAVVAVCGGERAGLVGQGGIQGELVRVLLFH